MATILSTKSIYYNDVNLIARPAKVKSRSDIPDFNHRIFVSPMSAIICKDFAIKALNLGLTVCLHKFCTPEDNVKLYNVLVKEAPEHQSRIFVSIGLDDYDRFNLLTKCGATNILIDCANGYLPHIKDTVNKVLVNQNIQRLIVGNVMNSEGIEMYNEYFNTVNYDNLMEFAIRVGIGGGSACSTSDMTGFNRGQITELIECSNYSRRPMSYMSLYRRPVIIADGGIKNGNYASKAFGAGADYIMVGGYFARAVEAYTNSIGDGTFWGGASTKQQELYGGVRRHSEGKVYTVNDIKPLDLLVKDLVGGIKSSVSYSGFSNIEEFIGNAVFEVKQNSLPPKS